MTPNLSATPPPKVDSGAKLRARLASIVQVVLGQVSRGCLSSFLVYLALFAALGAPWLRTADRAAPSGYFGNSPDERLVVWVLAWVSHALATNPLRILDANINHPAPAQLTGSEHFLTAQVAFAPIYAVTGNALLAANLTVLLTYPLAALAMQRLLLALGCASIVSWAGGLVYALGVLRVPAHLHLLQYTNLFVPLIALALLRLRESPGVRAFGWLVAALASAALSSFYMAVIGGVTGAIWGALEIVRPGRERQRYVVLALVAAGIVAALFYLSAIPYLTRPEAVASGIDRTADAQSVVATLQRSLAAVTWLSAGWVVPKLAALGLLAIFVRDAGARRCLLFGLPFVAIGWIMAQGQAAIIAGFEVPTPYALFASGPLRFFRYPWRFVLLVHFGVVLMAAAALQVGRVSLGARLGTIAALGVAGAVLFLQGAGLSGIGPSAFPGQTERVYDVVARAARASRPGALLELPYLRPLSSESPDQVGTEADAMLASTRHWLPLVQGFTGYAPPHRGLVDREVSRLPDPRSLARLVSMTNLRWILLRPLEQWPEASRPMRARIEKSPLLQLVASVDGWQLLRVDQSPAHPEWYRAIAAGPVPGRTLLGTPLEVIPAGFDRSIVKGKIGPDMLPSGFFLASLRVQNLGQRSWPVAVPEGSSSPHVVHLVADWRPAGSDPATPPTRSSTIRIPIDVAPLDTVSVETVLKAPPPGEYDLTVRVEQEEGARFAGPGNIPFEVRLQVPVIERRQKDPPAEPSEPTAPVDS